MHYKKPRIATDIAVKRLVPEGHTAEELTPDREVIAIHRGREPIKDKFDAIDYFIEPGYFEAPYAAVKHFQNRAVIPGTRNPLDGQQQQSFIGIPGVDPDEACLPLTDEQCARYGVAFEAIDRTQSIDPDDKKIGAIQTGFDERHSPRRGKGGPNLDVQATEEAKRRAADALAQPDDTDAARDAREAKAARRKK